MRKLLSIAKSTFALLAFVLAFQNSHSQNECDGTWASVDLTLGSFPSEVSYSIFAAEDSIALLSGNMSSTLQYVCLPDGCYDVYMYDSFGDGWNGADITISGNGAILGYGTFNSGFVGYFSFGINSEECPGANNYGCTDSTAYNFDPGAIFNAGCIYSGCTDATAVNYNYIATIDDGSCVYCEGEGSVLATVYICTFSNGQNVELQILDGSGNEVAYYDNLGTGSISYFELCLQAGECYTANMINNAGPFGWYGGYFWINAAGAQVINDQPSSTSQSESAIFSVDGTCGGIIYGCTDTSALNYNPEATNNDNSCIYPYPGCTDPAAYNYNYWANIEDGSCLYCSDSTGFSNGYICTFSNGNQVELQIVDDQGNEVIYVSNLNSGSIFYFDLCLEPGVCYTANMINNTGAFGWFSGYFWINNQGVQIATGQLFDGQETGSVEFSIDGTCGPVFGCTDPAALNYNPEASANDNSCIYPYYGCTDSTALNYNPYANTDDGSCVYPEECDENLLVFILNADPWPYEMSYFVFNENGVQVAYANGANTYACVADGCYSVQMYDSFGDGWTTGSVDVYLNNVLISNFTLSYGNYGTASFGVNAEGCQPSVYGCTDSLALNYNPLATENDGSCLYGGDCEANLVSITINTQAWGSEASWNLISEEGVVVAAGSGYDSWGSYSEYFCLETGCYLMVMEDSWGDGWNGGYYTITGNGTYNEGSLYYGSTAIDMVGINTWCSDSIPGCTDSIALNYNPYATMEDGSCIYNDNEGFSPDELAGLELELTLFPNPTNGGMILNAGGLSALGSIQIDIFSVTGQVIESRTINNSETYRVLELNVEEYPAGFYLLNLTNGDRTTQMSFIKQ